MSWTEIQGLGLLVPGSYHTKLGENIIQEAKVVKHCEGD